MKCCKSMMKFAEIIHHENLRITCLPGYSCTLTFLWLEDSLAPTLKPLVESGIDELPGLRNERGNSRTWY